MGAYCSKSKPYRILFQGLDAAGKTTVLYQLKLGEVVTTIPTIGFNVESISVHGFEIVGWDVGGRDKIRPLFRHYYPGTDGFIYVIDSADTERIDDALEEMTSFLLKEDATQDTVLMILANKQDLKGALPLEKIEEKVREAVSGNAFNAKGRCIFVQGCSALTREGLDEAFSLFLNTIKRQKEGKVLPGFHTFHSLEGDDINKMTKEDTAGREGKNSSQFHLLEKLSHIPILKSILFY